MRRREFIAALGGAATWPLVARAQQLGKLPTVGFLASGTPSSHGQSLAGFVQRLRELGWTEGRTVTIEVRWAEGRSERFTEIAREFVGLKVDVIVTAGGAAVQAKRVTSTIPIVFAAAADPLGAGLVANLARPGGNVTGLSMQNIDSTGKRLEFLREVVVGLRRLAILANMDYPAAVLESNDVLAAARNFDIEVVKLEIRRAEDIGPAFETLKEPVDALYVCSDPLVLTNRIRINTSALVARLPTIYGFREFVEAGGLISYGPNFQDLYRRSANYVDKILPGGESRPISLSNSRPNSISSSINSPLGRSDFTCRRRCSLVPTR